MFTDSERPTLANQKLDALIVGAGFSGVYNLHQLRKRGLSVKVVEAGSDLGGTWNWNRYPGARVDSDFRVYQFLMEDLWKDFSYTQRFPARKEIIDYFNYVDKKLDLRRDMVFNTRVTSAHFDTATDRWTVTADTGVTVYPRFLLLCTGFASKPIVPAFKGLDSFKGVYHHSSRFPQDGSTDFTGKRVGVVGTGASGVQIIQEASLVASHLTVFQRTPQFALPMRQYNVDDERNRELREGEEPMLLHVLNRRPQTFIGTLYDLQPKLMKDVTREEQILMFEELWEKGEFYAYLGTYADIFFDRKANDLLYAFWRKKVLQRISDPVLQEKLAPKTPYNAVGTIHFPCLEQRYFEVFSQPNVNLVSLREHPIAEITPKGVKTEDGVEHELDVLILATGFGPITGAITQIDIRGPSGVPIREKWDARLSTYLGMTSTGYPNMFFPYGPQAPTTTCNGPTCVELQGTWIANCIEYTLKNNHTRIEPAQEAEEGWYNFLQEKFSALLSGEATRSQTANGEVGDAPIFPAGVPAYMKMCNESADNGYKGFEFSSIKKERD